MNIKTPKGLSIGLITLFIVIVSWFFGLRQLIDNIETITYDWRAQIATDKGPFNSQFNTAKKDIILLSADDYTFQKLSQHPELKIGIWPWQRKVWGDVVNFVSKGKPKAIVFDIKFEGNEGSTQENISSDAYFARTIKNNPNIVLGMALSYPKYDIVRQINKTLKQNADYSDSEIYSLVKSNEAQIDKKFGVQIEDSGILPDKKDLNTKTLLSHITFYGYSPLAGIFLKNAPNLGIINLNSGENMIARYNVPIYKLTTDKDSVYIPSLPLSTMLSILPEKEKKPFIFEKNKITVGKHIIKLDNEGRVLINWHGPAGTYNFVSISDVLISDAYSKGKISKIDKMDEVSPEEFKDKIVVIGQTSAGTDIHPTPMQMTYPGPEIIATSIDNYLNDTDTTNPRARKFISKASLLLNLFILLAFCSSIGIFTVKSRSNIISISWFMLLIFLFILISTLVFIHPNIRLWINMSYPLIFMTLTAIGTYVYKIYVEEKNKKQVENLFGKFVSPQVLDKLLKDPKSVNRDGQRKVMTVLFSDIRGFTTLSESVEAQELIPQLNEYLTEMVEVVLKYNGTMDKFIGDAVMAFYGDPLPMKDHALRAVLTAINMRKTLYRLNEKWENEGKPNLDIGIGINTGDMIVGHIGSPKLVDYTVIGDNVNLASRIEGLNKEYKTDIIISESTYNDVSEFINAEYLDECRVKGKLNTVRIYKVLSIKEDYSEADLI